MEREGLDVEGINRLLNKESGVLGLSELSSDMRVFEDAIQAGPEHTHYERSMLVLKHYTLRVRRYIGSYAAAMGGLDCVVFTGGVGENFGQGWERTAITNTAIITPRTELSTSLDAAAGATRIA